MPKCSICGAEYKKQREAERCAAQDQSLADMKANWEKMTPEERDADLKKNLDELYGEGTFDAHKAMLKKYPNKEEGK